MDQQMLYLSMRRSRLQSVAWAFLSSALTHSPQSNDESTTSPIRQTNITTVDRRREDREIKEIERIIEYLSIEGMYEMKLYMHPL